MDKVLVSNDQYNGKYIALKSNEDNSIVGSGKNPSEALTEANKQGVLNPFILYIPDNCLITRSVIPCN
jgi:hypothetical protein